MARRIARWKPPVLLCAACIILMPVAAGGRPAPARQASTAVPSASAARQVPFAPGETLTYGVSWSNFLSAGTATLKVIEKKRSFDSVAYYIVAEAQPSGLVGKLYHLYYKLDTLMDVNTLLPQRGSIYSEEGRRRRYKTHLFDRRRNIATYEVKTATLVTREVTVPPACHDALSALYALREVGLKAGSRVELPVVESGRVYRIQFRVTGRETVSSELGSVAAWRVVPSIQRQDGRTEESGIELWVSDDARRVPVRIKVDLAVGSFSLLLRSAASATHT